MVKSITKFLRSDEHSYPSSNRVIQLPKIKDVPVRYRNKSINSLYHFWVLERNNANERICCETKFRSVLKICKWIKKPKKGTDMCHICVSGKKNEKDLVNLEKIKNPNTSQKLLLEKLKERKELYKDHKNIVDNQRNFFNNEISNINTTNKVIIVMDFKQNLTINLSHDVELGRDYYSSPQRTVFGVVVYYFEDNIIKKLYFDIFSKYMSHNSYFVTCALKKILSSNFFINKDFTNFSMWMDNGPHFKTKEVFGFFCKEFVDKGLKIKWNFFCEYHGKNPCDTRFSQISSMYKAHINNQNNFKVLSTSDLVRAIRNQQINLNEFRELKKKNPIDSF
jgi:hypothetical protein